MASHLDLYESLDIIGNGSFGIIRKVKRKSDGMIFARKELKFERMSERDKKQIVAEVNILKDLHHEHIVRYHDRYIDHDSGILYILMEYCSGGDLSTVIKQAVKQNRSIPEDTIWSYFMQILRALHYCHHPNGHGRASSGGPAEDGRERRPQILHRDLKPDNVFLSEMNTVKLGDFGLAKALAQPSFANTYVGTPYYMSPELMQERAYDSKSDIWSLGCLIFELCALHPPFHEAKTHAELSVCIRNGRIPPLPRQYSPALTQVVKAMLTLNPAMRPSAAQLLQHERIDFALKVSETEKMIAQIKMHKASAAAKEREVYAREALLKERESKLAQKDAELARAQSAVAAAVREAVAKREEELRALVLKREVEVAEKMQKREEEIMGAIRRRQEEINEAWRAREAQIRQEAAQAVEERMRWMAEREKELREEKERLAGIREELEGRIKALEERDRTKTRKERRDKTPFEEVKNILAPLSRLPQHEDRTPMRDAYWHEFPPIETPVSQSTKILPENSLLEDFAPPSAMKGVILTETGQPIATPAPSELAKLFVQSPKVGLNFSQIFDGDDDSDSDGTVHGGDIQVHVDSEESEAEADDEPMSPSARRESARRESAARISPCSSTETLAAPPTRLRRPSIRRSTLTPANFPPVSSNTTGAINSATSSTCTVVPASTSEPALPTKRSNDPPTTRVRTISRTTSSPPQYDFSDEENLPSPFLKKTEKDRGAITRAVSSSAALAAPKLKVTSSRRQSNNLLRVATVNLAQAAGGKGAGPTTLKKQPSTSAIRPSLASARRAGEEARRALHRS
ncbi:Pkinase-domain-containing protein [Gloeophyllum trabeum ATCC 11539]|uniref:non-specific serine/threonine protein kinase n=1 Tax=Gloeophyllum trabeum (strain ATCC 11539 / FP-39264 / Madison 617) TaxID=670483 RepID=S7Q652_GLOTA|nr:Pkinase-domain-containing protein [Gloeophyllum trabeum ATCC 11539]EPQ54967.1 Pkinase-domain-containing protein [Gloeophyllum trabeum ATCC 11539]